MDYEFHFHSRASKAASKLPRGDDERIQSKLIEMVTNEWRDLSDYGARKLSGTGYDIYRVRIGGYRVFFVLEGEKAVVLHIDQREGAYGNIGRLEQRADDVL